MINNAKELENAFSIKLQILDRIQIVQSYLNLYDDDDNAKAIIIKLNEDLLCVNTEIEEYKKNSVNITNNKFYLTEDHIKLMKNMYVDWSDSEVGSPKIDCKKPYGNSEYEYDIAEILEWEFNGELNETLIKMAQKLHRETEKALQIVLVTGKFETGVYYLEDEYDRLSWVKL